MSTSPQNGPPTNVDPTKVLPVVRAADSARSTARWKIAALLVATAIGAWSLGQSGRFVLDSQEIGTVTGLPPDPLPTPAAPPAPNEDCRGFDARASYTSNETPQPSPAVARIKARGKLIAGVSADTLLFGARNSLTGKLQGLDVDLVRQLAITIFGSNANDERVQFRVITYADRIPLLESGSIDVVAHTMTINCARWNRIAFSSEYYSAGQQLLVKSDSTAKEIEELPKGSRVCVPSGGTSVENLAKFTDNAFKPVQVDDITECLVLMQQGAADAVLSDDTVVKGMARQDPYVKVVGRFLSEEPYGIGFNAADTDLVQVTNAMLDSIRTGGTFASILTANSLPTDALPSPNTSRPLPTA
jgi:polar amino acid transport system substrate-binding protein